MNESRCGIPEERWVDWTLHRLPRDTAEAMSRHLTHCADCRRISNEWRRWLSMDGQEASVTHTMPSERVRKSLRLRAARNSLRHRLLRRPYVWVAGVAALLLLVIALQGMQHGPGAKPSVAMLPAKTYAELHVPEGAAVMELPDTKRIAVMPAFVSGLPNAASPRMVTVWVNGRTGEMFILLEGVLPAMSKDVQAWGTIRQQRTNLGLLEFNQAQAHLYSRFRHVPDVEEVAFTIEPKGGSLNPTAPESVRVLLVDADGP